MLCSCEFGREHGYDNITSAFCGDLLYTVLASTIGLACVSKFECILKSINMFSTTVGYSEQSELCGVVVVWAYDLYEKCGYTADIYDGSVKSKCGMSSGKI